MSEPIVATPKMESVLPVVGFVVVPLTEQEMYQLITAARSMIMECAKDQEVPEGLQTALMKLREAKKISYGHESVPSTRSNPQHISATLSK